MFLALQLKMTVAQLRAEMSNDEYLRWSMYFARRGQKLNEQQVFG